MASVFGNIPDGKLRLGKGSRSSCAKLWRLIDAEDHRELVHTLQVLARYDIPLNCALKEVEYPDYDDLSDAIEEEMNNFVEAVKRAA